MILKKNRVGIGYSQKLSGRGGYRVDGYPSVTGNGTWLCKELIIKMPPMAWQCSPAWSAEGGCGEVVGKGDALPGWIQRLVEPCSLRSRFLSN